MSAVGLGSLFALNSVLSRWFALIVVMIAVSASFEGPVQSSTVTAIFQDGSVEDEGQSAEKADKIPLDIESIGARRIIFSPMNVSVFARNRLVARANIELVMEVKDLADVDDIRLRKPQLRADFIAALNQLARQRFRVNEPIDPNLVKMFVMAYADRRLGPGKVEIYVLQAYVESL